MPLFACPPTFSCFLSTMAGFHRGEQSHIHTANGNKLRILTGFLLTFAGCQQRSMTIYSVYHCVV